MGEVVFSAEVVFAKVSLVVDLTPFSTNFTKVWTGFDLESKIFHLSINHI